MKITVVKPNGPTVNVDVKLENTVQELKNMLGTKLNLNMNLYSLNKETKVLNERLTLGTLNFEEGNLVHLLRKELIQVNLFFFKF